MKLLTRPSVLVPGLCGLGSLGLAAVVPGAGAFLGILGVSGLVIAAGMFVTGAVFDTQRIGKDTFDELQQAERQGEVNRLNRLAADLRSVAADGAITYVAKLKSHHQRLERGRRGEGFSIPDHIADMAEDLYERCVDALQRAVSLGKAMVEMSTDQVRQELGEKVATLLGEVDQGVHQLGLTLDRLQSAALLKDDTEEISRIREELDTGLQVARRVDQRMQELEHSLASPEDRRRDL